MWVLLVLGGIASAQSVYYYEGTRRIELYSAPCPVDIGSSRCFRTSPNPAAPVMIMSDNIIIEFAKEPSKETMEYLQEAYALTFLKKLPVGKMFYLAKSTRHTALETSRKLFENEKTHVRSATPDWLYYR
jgi:hypothetical protein